MEMAEFVLLWDEVHQLQLSDSPDTISWKWTNDRRYTAKSAYKAQLHGTFSTVNGSWIWKAFAEGKQKFFTWLLLQNKILTADNLIIRNWPCNEVCTFCDQELETATHLSCYFAREAWLKVSEWTGFSFTPISLDEIYFAD